MKAKKLLAVLLSLAVLVGLVPMAGMLTSAAEDPTVHYVKFDAAGKSSAIGGQFGEGTATATTEYTLDFDYYIPATADATQICIYSSGAKVTHVSGTHNINGDSEKPFAATDAGKIGHFNTVVTSQHSSFLFTPFLYSYGATEIYFWNVSVKINGTANAGKSYTDGVTHDTSKTLSQYDWAPKTAVTPAYPADVDVYKFAFGDVTGESSAVWDSFGDKTAADKTYTWSFDYCLVEGDNVRIFDAAEWNANKDNAVAFAATEYPTVGNNSFSKTFTLKGNGRFIPALQQTQSIDCGDLYVWNFSLVEEGTSKNLFDDVNLTGGNSSGLITKVQSKPEASATPDYPEDIDVYKFAFGDVTGQYNVFYDKPEGQLTVGKTYTWSFDYCLVSGDPVKVQDAASWDKNKGNEVKVDQSEWPTVGNGKFTKTFTAAGNGKFIPCFEQPNADTDCGDLYVWNFSITEEGSTTNLFENVALTSGTATSGLSVTKVQSKPEAGGNEGGNEGNEGGNTGNEGGNTGNEGGNTGNEGGNTGNEGGNTGNEGGNTGNEGGNEGNEGGNTGNEGGNTDNDGGNDTAGDDEDESPDTGDTMTGVAMAAVVLALAGAALMVSKKRNA